jgi:hypothetical protein
MEAGCNPAVVLKELLLYCGPDLGVLALWEKKSKYAKTQLGTISAQLEQDARVIESIARDVSVRHHFRRRTCERHGLQTVTSVWR